MAGALRLRACVIQVSRSAAASRSSATALSFPAARMSAVKQRAKPVTARAVSSCSTRLTMPAPPSSETGLGCTIHRRGPWRSFEAVEYATLEWVDWYNHRRLLAPIGNVPPAEAEARYHTHVGDQALAA